MYHKVVLAAVVTVLPLAAVAPPALAGDPVEQGLHASYHPAYTVGGRLNADAVSAEVIDESFGLLSWPARLHFRATGGTTTIERLRVADEPTQIAEFHTVQGTVGLRLSNYDGEQGGDSQRTSGWQLTNSYLGFQSGWVTSAGSAIVGTDGEVQASGPVGTIGEQVYSGNWVHRSGAELPAGRYIGRTAARSTTPGDSMSVEVSVNRGTQFAVIMRKSALGGQAAMYVDGKLVRTVDLHAPRVTTRVVANVRLSAGTHVLSVKNSSSAGSDSRVTLDAMLIAGGYVSPQVLPGPGFAGG